MIDIFMTKSWSTIIIMKTTFKTLIIKQSVFTLMNVYIRQNSRVGSKAYNSSHSKAYDTLEGQIE